MTERFNSGNGGYTCDTCRVLLWAGFDGRKVIENRKWWYHTKPEDVRLTKTHAFCSILCMSEFKEDEDE